MRCRTARGSDARRADHGLQEHLPRAPQNRFSVACVGELEEPFEWIIKMRTPGQPEGSESIWWRLPKDKRPAVFPGELGIAPVNVLPLV